jgi:hypothetical protein
VRGFLLRLFLLPLGLWPSAVAWSQVQPVEASVGAEQPATGQPSTPPGTPASEKPSEPITTPGAAPPPLQASPLDTFLLKDSKGNLVPVLGMSFEEFEQLLRLKKGLASPAPPSLALETLSLTGTTKGNVANFQVTATIRIHEDGWVRVPLLMPSAVMRELPNYKGPGEYVVSYDAGAGGYVCWLKGKDALPHVVTLQVSTAVHSVGDERRLTLNLPRATESSLGLLVDESHLGASLIAGEGIVSARPAAENRSEITVLGAAGDMQLAWRAANEVVSKDKTQLDVSGDIIVRIESEHRVTSDARLRVRSYGGFLETFRVRLPPGMELVPLPVAGGFTVTPLTGPGGGLPARTSQTPQVVEVRLDKPATAAVEVVLRAQREAEARPALLQPARFEVLGAVRNRGTIDFTMDGEWQLDWTEDKSVHRLDLTPDTAAARIVARFEYFQQPCGLQLGVKTRPSRVTVEPTYIVQVDRQRVRIETMLKYRFRGTRAAAVTFEMNGWTFDRLSPDSLLDTPVINGVAPDQVQVPFLAGAAPPTELELKLEAHRLLSDGQSTLDVAFPRPVADVVAPATIVISAADNVELTPKPADIVGLSSEPTVIRLPGRQQQPLVYRDLGGGEPARFSAGLRILPRTVVASARAHVRIDRQQAQIEQRIDYRVAHEPKQTFVLLAARELVAGGNLQVILDGESLPINPIPRTDLPDPGLAALEFSTPTDRLGAFEVAVQYTTPVSWSGQKQTSVILPLVLPLDDEETQFTGQRVEFTLPDGVLIASDAESIDELDRPLASDGVSHAFSWPSAVYISRWTLEPSPEAKAASVVVSQMWIQTWLGSTTRQERVAMRLNTMQESLRVRLPTSVRQASVQAAIDGYGVPRKFYDPGAVVVSVPAALRGRTCVLEVFYALEPPATQLGLISDRLESAKIDDAAPPKRIYWQLALPEQEHLLLPPADLAKEMAWTFDRGFVARRPIMDQRQLEAWIKASAQDSLPRNVNTYLFGALGRWPVFEIKAANRRLIVAVASGSLLALGLLLLHVPQLRSPQLLMLVAVVLGAAALVAPDAALLAAQAAVFGLLVMTVATAWAFLASGRVVFRFAPAAAPVPRPRDSQLGSAAVVRSERSSRLSATVPAQTAAVEVRP